MAFTRVFGGKTFHLFNRTDFKRQAVEQARRMRKWKSKPSVRVSKFPEGSGWGVFTRPKLR